MAAKPQYELRTLVGGTWRQWSNAAGQDYYKNLNTGTTQYNNRLDWRMPIQCVCIKLQDMWAVDGSKCWPQWRNTRTGRIRRTNPNPPAPRTYLDKANVQTYLQLVERSPESHEYLYRRIMVAVLRHFFLEDEGFEVVQEESRGDLAPGESRVDVAVLKITSRPGGSPYTYDYCLVESKKADRSWADNTEDHLSRHCAGIENHSGQVYFIIHTGLYVQFFTADRGGLTALSGGLHIQNNVNAITTMFANMKRQPLPFL